MGHYDSSYEHDEKQYEKRLQKQCKKLMDAIDKIRVDMPDGTPDRYDGKLCDVYNYLFALSKNSTPEE